MQASVTLRKRLGRWHYKGVPLTTEQLLRLSLAEARGEMRIIRKEAEANAAKIS